MARERKIATCRFTAERLSIFYRFSITGKLPGSLVYPEQYTVFFTSALCFTISSRVGITSTTWLTTGGKRKDGNNERSIHSERPERGFA